MFLTTVRPAAQQLLGKVGLLRAAAATPSELRASAAAATVQRDRAAPGRTGLPASVDELEEDLDREGAR